MQGVPIILVCFPTDVIFVQEDRVVVIFFVLTQDFEGIIVKVDPREDKEGNFIINPLKVLMAKTVNK